MNTLLPDSASRPPFDLLALLLKEQQSLTAVDRFATRPSDGKLRGQFFRDLIPLDRPKPGEQYAFQVDLGKCSGCKACVTACHSLNGLEEQEAWRSVGAIVSADAVHPSEQTITTACHHCLDPACLNGCPVLAYEKDPVTGIVRHLDDQCIGCQYCALKCPYDVPKFSERLGIVRKCDMCSNRLEAGEPPACVQACPHEAITITICNRDGIETLYREESKNKGFLACPDPLPPERKEKFLPASPDPAYTLPTTRYIPALSSTRQWIAADAAEIKPEPPHWPLVWMLVLTQAGVGGLTAACFTSPGNRPLIAASASLGLLGLFASILHLGKPLKAWRAFLGVRRSWLSREIIVFGAFAAFAAWSLGSTIMLNESRLILMFAALTGLAGVACSVLVYHDTRRAFWKGPWVAAKFFGTTMICATALSAAWESDPFRRELALGLLPGMALARLALDAAPFAVLRKSASPLSRVVRLLAGPLQDAAVLRALLLGVGGVVLPLLGPADSWAFGFLPFLFIMAAEIAERYLFFRAASEPKMPGGQK